MVQVILLLLYIMPTTRWRVRGLFKWTLDICNFIRRRFCVFMRNNDHASPLVRLRIKTIIFSQLLQPDKWVWLQYLSSFIISSVETTIFFFSYTWLSVNLKTKSSRKTYRYQPTITIIITLTDIPSFFSPFVNRIL